MVIEQSVLADKHAKTYTYLEVNKSIGFLEEVVHSGVFTDAVNVEILGIVKMLRELHEQNTRLQYCGNCRHKYRTPENSAEYSDTCGKCHIYNSLWEEMSQDKPF